MAKKFITNNIPEILGITAAGEKKLTKPSNLNFIGPLKMYSIIHKCSAATGEIPQSEIDSFKLQQLPIKNALVTVLFISSNKSKQKATLWLVDDSGLMHKFDDTETTNYSVVEATSNYNVPDTMQQQI